MLLYEWADSHGIPHYAIEDLLSRIGIYNDVNRDEKQGEQEVQQRVRIEAGKAGCVLWRNNSGVTENHVRYGLANDNPAINKRIKSHDLIGIRPIIITPEMVGRKIGQFVSRECKRSGWKYSEKNKRDEAQLKFALIVLSYGGDAAFADGPGSI